MSRSTLRTDGSSSMTNTRVWSRFMGTTYANAVPG
jgi:hypothetical protein